MVSADDQPRTPLPVKKIVNKILQRFLYLKENFFLYSTKKNDEKMETVKGG
jgi:hypothetical protein